MSAINEFLLRHDLRIASNPCVSPDFCLDWPALQADLMTGRAREHAKSRFATKAGDFTLWENAAGDCAWQLHAVGHPLADGIPIGQTTYFPATWANLLTLKNLVQEHDAGSTIFPTAGVQLGRSTLGVGARFTTLHWPAVEWAMSALELGLTANQNSIPRELVYDVDAMLANRLDTVPFPFIGTNVPEGHQGQSVEGMSHGCVLSKLKTGFHRRRVAWSFNALLATVWTPLQKMKRRDDKYAAARAAAFTTPVGRTYLRELSIDELPGLTTPETTAIMLALCEVLGMPVNFVAPAFGFQKNTPYPDNAALRALIQKQWDVCTKFGVSIGFHSGSGKSAENYRVMGEVTGSRLEIKTSGRYTYEMGVALSQSSHPADAALWRDWYQFTVDMAVAGAFSPDATEQKMARVFVTTALAALNRPTDVFATPATCRAALAALPPSAEHMTFFEYNFLYVLAAGGRPEKAALGDHSPAGYAQRARFYAISPEARLRFAKRIAAYLIFLAEHTGLAPQERCAGAGRLLESYTTLEAMLGDISR